MEPDRDTSNEPVIRLLGTVTNGVIVLNDGATVPEGTQVQVLVPVTAEAAASPLGQRLLRLAGAVKGMPSDFAAQHDHYIHGTPQR